MKKGNAVNTRENILKILRQADSYVSGEKISSELNISRAAVNSAVKSLRREGYDIGSVTNRGYMLISAPDILNQTEVAVCLCDDERMNRVEVLKSIDSTNSELIRRAVAGAENGQVIISDEQTGGKGRKGRAFSSPKNMGIYFSYLFRPSVELKKQIISEESDYIWASLTSWTAVAASDAIEKSCGVRPGIKWVNDLYMNGHKIAGILTQMNTSAESRDIESIVIGIGINVREEREDFAEEIREKAGSLFTGTGKKIHRAVLAAELIRAFDKMIADWPKEKKLYHKKYSEGSIVMGRNITISTDTYEKDVKAIGIDEDFALITESKAGEINHIISGDVSVRI